MNYSHFLQLQSFTQEVIKIIQSIPCGKVQTYCGIARLAGNPRGARQVSRILHSLSEKYNLPWHRVINSKGKISLKNGFNIQKAYLESEGIWFQSDDSVNLNQYLWNGSINS
ncbi:MAG: MGMT family protein [Candidatus Lokiarchaeota archaeon]|nr:MGMT family protein [Candidatus Harpocratesius repetitus]